MFLSPLVSGAFGELNVEGHRLVALCARFAAAQTDNADITPPPVLPVPSGDWLRGSSDGDRGEIAPDLVEQRPTMRQAPTWFNNLRNESLFGAFFRYRTQYDHFLSDDRNRAGF